MRLEDIKNVKDGDIVTIDKNNYILVETNVDNYYNWIKIDMNHKIGVKTDLQYFAPRTFMEFNTRDIRKWRYVNLYDKSASLARKKADETTLLKIRLLYKDKINKDLPYIILDENGVYGIPVYYDNFKKQYIMASPAVKEIGVETYPLILAKNECYVDLGYEKREINLKRHDKTAKTINKIKEYGIVKSDKIRRIS